MTRRPEAGSPDAAVAREFIRDLEDLRAADVAFAGGKGANLGELILAGMRVPRGFVIGAPAFAETMAGADLTEMLETVADGGGGNDGLTPDQARARVREAPLSDALLDQIREACEAWTVGDQLRPMAVRSSATAEDSPEDSFAGMNETFLNVTGVDALIGAVRDCWASLYSERAVAYRRARGIPETGMAIAVVVQEQIQAISSGVMFTADPVTGAHDRLVIEAAFGLGESIVSGQVTPDRLVISKETGALIEAVIASKTTVIESLATGGIVRRDTDADAGDLPAISHDQARKLGELGSRIEDHYRRAQDIEWAIDTHGDIFILQARPVTTLESAQSHDLGTPIVSGLGAAGGIGIGVARIVSGVDRADRVREGEVLVAPVTTPDWAPAMRRAAAVVTEVGGVTCHAAIVARELGIPCLVGAAGATELISDGEWVKVDAARGQVMHASPDDIRTAGAVRPQPTSATGFAPPVTATRLLVNISEPSVASRAASEPVDGVGLLRAELMILEALDGRHPRLLLEEEGEDALVSKLAEGIGAIGQAFSPRPVTYRTYDFRTNEFRSLRGGDRFEPEEANPMIGFRGAFRYSVEPELLRAELTAVKRLRDEGLTNLRVMVPFVRTPGDLRRFLEIAEPHGVLDLPGFELWIMAEVPSILFHLPAYATLGISGISIGSNDLTQLMLGADRDSALLSEAFDERDPAVVGAIQQLISAARELGLATSICGQAPSVHPEYAQMLVEAGVDSISVTLDAVTRTRVNIAAAEQHLILAAARAVPGVASSVPPNLR